MTGHLPTVEAPLTLRNLGDDLVLFYAPEALIDGRFSRRGRGGHPRSMFQLFDDDDADSGSAWTIRQRRMGPVDERAWLDDGVIRSRTRNGLGKWYVHGHE